MLQNLMKVRTMMTMVTMTMVTDAEGQLAQTCCRSADQVNLTESIAVQLMSMVMAKPMAQMAL